MLTIEKKSLKVGKYVNTEHVNTVISNYKRERWVHNSQRIGKEDSMSAWYSVEELEEFIEKIKEHGANGIRFYFAAYSPDYADVPAYADRQTIVMVGSKAKRTEAGIVNKDVYINTEEGSTILAYNSGAICPPFNCPGGKSGSGTVDGDDWGGIGTTLIDCGDQGMVIV
jgi:hypothetical protein